jgi:hypothetical protein
MTLWGCAFEDLATRVFEPDGRNLVDEYLKRRGWNETGPNKIYMRALKASVMSVYEVSAIEPGVGFLARDLIRGGEPVQVRERTASKTLGQWDRIGARIVPGPHDPGRRPAVLHCGSHQRPSRGITHGTGQARGPHEADRR